MIPVSDLDILSLASTAKLSSVRITTVSSSASLKMHQKLSLGRLYIRLGRCVIIADSGSTAPIATREQVRILRNILIALLSCHIYIKRKISDHSASRRKTRLSDIVRSIEKRYSKRPLSEILNIIEQYPPYLSRIYFAIPRSIPCQTSQSAKDLADLIFIDYCEFMEHCITLLKDGTNHMTNALYSYVRTSAHRTGMRLGNAISLLDI